MIELPHIFGNGFMILQVHHRNMEIDPSDWSDGILDIGGRVVELRHLVSIIIFLRKINRRDFHFLENGLRSWRNHLGDKIGVIYEEIKNKAEFLHLKERDLHLYLKKELNAKMWQIGLRSAREETINTLLLVVTNIKN